MTHYTDIPVRFDQIRIGDYVTATRRQSLDSPDVNEGFVVHKDDSALRVARPGGGRSGNNAHTFRTFTRRVLTSNTAWALTDPATLEFGDDITVVSANGRTITTGTVDSPSYWVRWTADVEGRQIFRLITDAPTPPASTSSTMVRPEVGDTFTRTYTSEFSRDRLNCRVVSVTDHDSGDGSWVLRYTRPESDSVSVCRVYSDGTVSGGSVGPANGRYVAGPSTPDTVTWIPATPENVSVGSVIMGTPRAIGGILQARVDSVSDGDVSARTTYVIEPTRHGREEDLERAYYYYDYPDFQVWAGATPEPPAPVTEAPSPADWHEIQITDLQPSDQIRAVLTRSDGTEDVVEGTVEEVDGPRVRVQMQGESGTRTVSLRRQFYVANRTPDAPQDLATRYPTIHHLKAAIYDVTLANYRSGAWCSDAHDFVRELGITTDLYESTRDAAQAEVQEMITKLQGERAGARGISSDSLDAAFMTLGIPRTPPPPPTRRFQVEIDVPSHLTSDQIRAMLQASSNVNSIHYFSEVPR